MESRVPIQNLSVRPLPPPFTGTTVSFQIFTSEIEARYANVTNPVIDTSQKKLKEEAPILSTDNLRQAISTIASLTRRIRAQRQCHHLWI